MIGGIRASSPGQGGIDRFPPHPLNHRHVRRGLLFECPHQFFQRYGRIAQPAGDDTPVAQLLLRVEILRFEGEVGLHQRYGVHGPIVIPCGFRLGPERHRVALDLITVQQMSAAG